MKFNIEFCLYGGNNDFDSNLLDLQAECSVKLAEFRIYKIL